MNKLNVQIKFQEEIFLRLICKPGAYTFDKKKFLHTCFGNTFGNTNFISHIMEFQLVSLDLNTIKPMISFYTPCKQQKTRDFLMFSGVCKETSGMKWV